MKSLFAAPLSILLFLPTLAMAQATPISVPATSAAAPSLDPAALALARQAVQYNTPKDALLAGTSPLASHPMFAQVMQRLDFNKINEQSAVLMAQTFSQQEIKALLDFLSSPMGQRITMKMPSYQLLVGSMLQNEMKAGFEGLLLSQGAQNNRANSANGAAIQGLQGLTPLPMAPSGR